jgi:hypothetical protein
VEKMAEGLLDDEHDGLVESLDEDDFEIKHER